MAFASTITITINSVAKVLNRVSDSEPYSSEYMLRTSTDEYRVKIRHTHQDPKGLDALARGVDRHVGEFTHVTFATPTTREIRRRYSALMELQGADDVAAASLDFVAFGSYIAGSTRVDDLLAWLS